MKYRPVCYAVVLLLSTRGLAQIGGNQKLENAYSCLINAVQIVAESGLDSHTLSKMQRTRQVFLDEPQPAASLLILKLDSINAGEMKYFSGTRRLEDIVKYSEEHRSARSLKTYVTSLLADLYPHVSPATQSEILAALKRSFTPIFSLKEDLLSLQWALWHIGADSIPALLEVSQHPENTIRCGVQEGLNSLAAEIAEGGPVLNCKDTSKMSEQSISKWRQWWLAVGSKRPFKKVPSLFESLEISIQPKP